MAEGHRKRLRERYLQGGISAVSEIEIIELLLYNAVPRKYTREIAEKLINKFGSIYNIIEAPQEEVESVESIGRSIAAFLHCLKDFIFFYNLGNVHPGRYFSMITDIGDYIVQKYGNVENQVGHGQGDAARKEIFGELLYNNGQTGKSARNEAGRVVDGGYGKGYEGGSCRYQQIFFYDCPAFLFHCCFYSFRLEILLHCPHLVFL